VAWSEWWVESAEERGRGWLGEETCLKGFISVGGGGLGSAFGLRRRVAARAFVFESCRLARDLDEVVELLLSLESDRFISLDSRSLSEV
jgi:hypothetical protein